jgi:ubiquinone/menaquinone biosynthesis C-methylase UbiE
MTSNPQYIVCPWWLCFIFDNVFRRLIQNPGKILGPYVVPGWTVLDVGPGMGYFTIPFARLVGSSGKVIAADLQKHMLDSLRRRAVKAGVQDRIKLQQCTPSQIGIDEPIDFCLVFWMAHEVLDRARFFGEIYSALKPGGLVLLAEPRIHVTRKDFINTVSVVESTGLAVVERPVIFLSYSVLLKK